MHYYTFNPKDYISKTSFLEPIEDIAYRRMLDHYYLTEEPLPKNIEEIAMLIRMRSHCDSIALVLRMFFEATADGYINDRAKREIDAYHEKSERAKASAMARWSKKSNEVNGLDCDANALLDECESNANNKQLTNNHKQLTSNKDIDSDKPKRFDFKKALIESGGSEDLVIAFMAIRKTKKATNSEKAFELFMTNVGKSNQSLNQILEICVQRDWKGFDPSWLQNQKQNRGTDNFHDQFYGVGQSPFGHTNHQSGIRDVSEGYFIEHNDDRKF